MNLFLFVEAIKTFAKKKATEIQWLFSQNAITYFALFFLSVTSDLIS